MSLRVWMPLTKDLRQQGLDSTTVTQNSGTTISSGGKLGSCLTATSNATVVVNLPSLATMLANGKSYSLACWVKITGNVTTDSWIIKLGTNNCGLWWAASEARWVWNENDGGKRCANPTISADTTNWHHLVTTVTKSSNGSTTTARHYVDGMPATSYEIQTWDNSGKAQPTGTTITISPYAASLNDIRLYDHCLSESEIKRLTQGLIVHYPLNRQGLGQENLLPVSDSTIINSTQSFEFQGWVQNFYTKTWMNEHLTPGKQYTLSYTVTCLSIPDSTYTFKENRPSPILVHQGGGWSQITTTSDGIKDTNMSVGQSRDYKCTFTFATATENYEYYGLCGYTALYRNSSNNTQYAKFRIDNLKLEEGSIATPWSPSSYDSLFEVLTYDKIIYTEPDGTKWIRIAHHNNPANALFVSTDDFVNSVYKDTNRWYQVEEACGLLNSNEFMVKQKNTSDATEAKFRWVQTKSLLTATYNDVAPSTITKNTTTGYTDGTYGGIYITNYKARLCIADGTSGNWWGAIGSWTAYQGGIPGHPTGGVVTTGYIDLYIRVDNVNIDGLIEYDCSGFCNNGTRTGTFTWTSDTPKYNVSTKFSGSNYIKTLPGEFSWSNYDNLTIAAWIKPTATPSSWTGSVGIASDASSYTSKAVAISNYGGKFSIHIPNGSTWGVTQSTYTIPLNTWHHCVATISGTTVKMYVDGVLNKTFTADFGTATNHASPQIQVGIDLPGGDEIYNGYYSDVRIYATALSAADVKSLYQNCATIGPDGTIYGQIRS